MESKNKRTLARIFAFKFLYHYNLAIFSQDKNSFDEELIREKLKEFELTYLEKDHEHPENVIDQSIRNFSHHLILNIRKDISSLEENLKTYLKKWKIESLDKVDLTILSMGLFEILFEKDTPGKVIINEYVEMGKTYGAQDSYAFINGILNEAAKAQEKI